MRIERLVDRPIITPQMLPGEDGGNINGPSLIRVPDWIDKPLGKYYLYFAHHQGKYIRLAYADELTGPWQIYEGGVHHIDEVEPYCHHIASPDVHVDHDKQEIVMFHHGPIHDEAVEAYKPYIARLDVDAVQMSSSSVSKDGLSFKCHQVLHGRPYMRMFQHQGQCLALCWGGQLIASDEYFGIYLGDNRPMDSVIKPLAEKYERRVVIRHLAIDQFEDHMMVYFSCIGDQPEQLYRCRVDFNGPIANWTARDFEEVLKSERSWEGSDEPIKVSEGGAKHMHVHELRDPAIYREEGKLYLLYSTAGEKGIGIAQIIE